jgi:hypothetical protein
MDEVTAAAATEIQRVDAETGHLVIAFVDEALALTPQSLEIGWGHGVCDDEVALVAKAAACHRHGDARNRDGHAVPLSTRVITESALMTPVSSQQAAGSYRFLR